MVHSSLGHWCVSQHTTADKGGVDIRWWEEGEGKEGCHGEDNKSVYVASNVHGVGDGSNTTRRYSKTVHRKISVSQPDVIKMYNKMMGGVDLVDQQIACYRPRIRKRKW